MDGFDARASARAALNYTDELIQRFGARLAGSEAGRQAAVQICADLSEICGEAQAEDFKTRPGSFHALPPRQLHFLRYGDRAAVAEAAFWGGVELPDCAVDRRAGVRDLQGNRGSAVRRKELHQRMGGAGAAGRGAAAGDHQRAPRQRLRADLPAQAPEAVCAQDHPAGLLPVPGHRLRLVLGGVQAGYGRRSGLLVTDGGSDRPGVAELHPQAVPGSAVGHAGGGRQPDRHGDHRGTGAAPGPARSEGEEPPGAHAGDLRQLRC